MKLFFLGTAKAVVVLLLLIAVLFCGILAGGIFLEGKGFFGGLALGLWSACLYCFWLLFKRGVFSRYLAVMVFVLVGVVCCFYFGMPHKQATDKEICADLGVCSEKVVSEYRCNTLAGKWRFIGGTWLCYMKWAVYQPK